MQTLKIDLYRIVIRLDDTSVGRKEVCIASLQYGCRFHKETDTAVMLQTSVSYFQRHNV